MYLQAPNISCRHAFTTRHGGKSTNEFESLNLGGSEDEPQLISMNRDLILEQSGFKDYQLCNLKQVHGDSVVNARPGQQEGDAIVTNEPNLVLAVSIADCYPLLFIDPVNRIIGASHAGWRGTVKRIALKTIERMKELGAQPANMQAAIGQGISREKFVVGDEVVKEFMSEGFSENLLSENKIDLIGCNLQAISEAGINNKDQIWVMNRCTFEEDFFSYRRDNGKTGRMWALIGL